MELVRVCAEIGIGCINPNPEEKPDIGHIIKRLVETERTCGLVENELCKTPVSFLISLSSPIVYTYLERWLVLIARLGKKLFV